VILPTLHIHAALDGYALAFVTPDLHEIVAVFPTMAAARKAKLAATEQPAAFTGSKGSHSTEKAAPMKVSEVMTAQVVTATPETSVRKVAKMMGEIDTGAMPVMEEDRVIGMITDRDIVLRVVAEGGNLDQPIRDVMSGDIQSCNAEDSLADATAKMGAHQVRRLVVLNDAGRLAGILSLGDVAVDYGAKQVGKTLEEISESADA
jgi:CBS domain-containing protein